MSSDSDDDMSFGMHSEHGDHRYDEDDEYFDADDVNDGDGNADKSENDQNAPEDDATEDAANTQEERNSNTDSTNGARSTFAHSDPSSSAHESAEEADNESSFGGSSASSNKRSTASSRLSMVEGLMANLVQSQIRLSNDVHTVNNSVNMLQDALGRESATRKQMFTHLQNEVVQLRADMDSVRNVREGLQALYADVGELKRNSSGADSSNTAVAANNADSPKKKSTGPTHNTAKKKPAVPAQNTPKNDTAGAAGSAGDAGQPQAKPSEAPKGANEPEGNAAPAVEVVALPSLEARIEKIEALLKSMAALQVRNGFTRQIRDSAVEVIQNQARTAGRPTPTQQEVKTLLMQYVGDLNEEAKRFLAAQLVQSR